MTVRFHRNFEKRYRLLRPTERKKTDERLLLFLQDPYHPLLNNHPLKGKYLNYRSINITGDLRALYKLLQPGTYFFVTIDTHSNLYRS